VVDETLAYFRANVLFRKFDVQGAPRLGASAVPG